jgi:hypothetical protein
MFSIYNYILFLNINTSAAQKRKIIDAAKIQLNKKAHDQKEVLDIGTEAI